jgi:Fur family transcriptional regulator, ferric uptake regulator
MIPDSESVPLPTTPLCSVFRRHLKSLDLKYTQERADILAAVMARDGFFEPETLFLEMTRAGHRVSRATIYRTLRLLQDCGIIVPALVDAKQTRYELAYGRRPRNLLVCVRTGRVVEFESPELASLRDEICRRHGFSPIGHRVMVYGVAAGDAVPAAATPSPTASNNARAASRPPQRPSKSSSPKGRGTR